MAPPPSVSPDGVDRHDDNVYAPPESLVPTVVTAAKWTAGAIVFREVARVGTSVFLARLLTPTEWGLAAMALVPLAFFALATSIAESFLIQRARITEADRSTVFWLSLGLGTSTTTVAILMSGPISRFFGEPEIRGLFAAASLTLVISSLDKVPEVLRTRELAFRSLEIRDIAALTAGGTMAVVLAFAGAGAWSIIANSLVTAATYTTLVWAMRNWRPRMTFSARSLRNVTGFGGPLLGSQIMTWLQMNVDKVLTGRYLGPSALGEYSFAYALMFRPVINIAFPLQGILFPAFASLQADDERLKNSWLRAKRIVVAIMAPAFVTVYTTSPDFVPVVFGTKWQGTVPVLQVLCVAGVAYSLGVQDWNLLMVRNRVGTILAMTLLNASVISIGVATGLSWGLLGVATGLAVAQWSLVVPQMTITTRAGAVGFRETFQAALSPLPFAVVAGVMAWFTRIALVDVGFPQAGRIVITSAVLMVAYTGLAYAGSAPLRAELKGLRNRLPRIRSAGE